jgi:hypothetical protein
MRQAAAILAAVAATPLVIAVSFTVLSLWPMVTVEDWSPWLAISGWILVSTFAVPAVLAVVVIAAVPLARRLQRRGTAGFGSMIHLGVMLGVLPFLFFDGYVVGFELFTTPAEAPGRLMADLPVALKWATLAALCGAGSAAAYWAVLRPR